MQTRLNVRPGPILNITWKCVDSHLKLGRYLETNEHKTGRYFDVAISMEKDQIQFMEELRISMQEEFGQLPPFVFINDKHAPETKIATLINEAFVDMFGDDPNNERFNANSIRKIWEMHVKRIDLPANHKEAHLPQTAHSEMTAKSIIQVGLFFCII